MLEVRTEACPSAAALAEIDATTETALTLERLLLEFAARSRRALSEFDNEVERYFEELPDRVFASVHRLHDVIGRMHEACGSLVKDTLNGEPVLRAMFDAFDLAVIYDPGERMATCEVTLADDTLAGVRGALSVVTDTQSAELGILCGALGGIRTPNLLIRSQMLYPLSYERRRARTA